MLPMRELVAQVRGLNAIKAHTAGRGAGLSMQQILRCQTASSD
jgi:putative component of membrane protein insertase Oxa1/YidC/SpoIIIJ protein YidD